MEKEKRKFLKYSKLFKIPIEEFYSRRKLFKNKNTNEIIKRVLEKYKLLPVCNHHFDYCIRIKQIFNKYNIKIKSKKEFKAFLCYEKNFNVNKKEFRKFLKLYNQLKSLRLATIFLKYNVNSKNHQHIYFYYIDKNKYNKKFKNRKFLEKYGINWYQYKKWLKIYNLENNRLNAKKYVIIKKYDLYYKNKKLYFRLSGNVNVYYEWLEKTNMSKESFIKRYGKELGLQKYNEFRRKSGYASTKEYFIEKYGKELGEQKYKELNKKKTLSKEKMIEKYGEEEGLKKWNEFCRKNSYTNTLEFYIERYGKEEGTKRFNKWKNTLGQTLRIDYWLKKGYTEEQAKEIIKERQATNRLDKLILKYGPIQGYIKWYNRQQKWLNTLNSKSEEEKRKINKKKAHTLKNYIKKYGKEEGTRKYKEYYKKIIPYYYSKESIKFFQPIYDFLIQNGFKDDDIYWKKTEYKIYDKKNKKYKSYDFTILKLNVIIEYHGSIWHYNPNYNYPENFVNPFSKLTLEKLKENDKIKKELAIKNGFKFFTVFDTDDFKEKQTEIINYLKEIICQN